MKYAHKINKGWKKPSRLPATAAEEGTTFREWYAEAQEAFEEAFWDLVPLRDWEKRDCERNPWSWIRHIALCGEARFAEYKSVWRVLTRHTGLAGTQKLYEFRRLGREVAHSFKALMSE